MRFEHTCPCGATIAVENVTEDIDEMLALQSWQQAYFETQVASHIANCRKALANYALKDMSSNEQ